MTNKTKHFSTYKTTIGEEEYFVNVRVTYPLLLWRYSFRFTISSIVRQKSKHAELKIGKREIHSILDKEGSHKENIRKMDMYALDKIKEKIAAEKLILR
ncbi:hypothetical protein K4L44_09590 [Halosquirtibacter laminarini]|uniref:Uncharacterized protein n=1 Tax=Halosquirtibacter laminarini TaxID=3374600 RepID=A0AC61NBN6_9BACT|nr:hypothetical protein K4L44_09590 [Prolixibacteraceae bacterium]